MSGTARIADGTEHVSSPPASLDASAAPGSPPVPPGRQRPRRPFVIACAAAAALSAGVVLWSLPGADALAADGGGFICLGDIPGNAGTNTAQFTYVFTNTSDVAVTIDDVGVLQQSGLRIVSTHARTHPAGSSGQAPSVVSPSTAPVPAEAGPEWKRGNKLEVASGATATFTFAAVSTNPDRPWNASASDVRVRYHAWTQIPRTAEHAWQTLIKHGACPTS